MWNGGAGGAALPPGWGRGAGGPGPSGPPGNCGGCGGCGAGNCGGCGGCGGSAACGGGYGGCGGGGGPSGPPSSCGGWGGGGGPSGPSGPPPSCGGWGGGGGPSGPSGPPSSSTSAVPGPVPPGWGNRGGGGGGGGPGCGGCSGGGCGHSGGGSGGGCGHSCGASGGGCGPGWGSNANPSGMSGGPSGPFPDRGGGWGAGGGCGGGWSGDTGAAGRGMPNNWAPPSGCGMGPGSAPPHSYTGISFDMPPASQSCGGGCGPPPWLPPSDLGFSGAEQHRTAGDAKKPFTPAPISMGDPSKASPVSGSWQGSVPGWSNPSRPGRDEPSFGVGRMDSMGMPLPLPAAPGQSPPQLGGHSSGGDFGCGPGSNYNNRLGPSGNGPSSCAGGWTQTPCGNGTAPASTNNATSASTSNEARGRVESSGENLASGGPVIASSGSSATQDSHRGRVDTNGGSFSAPSDAIPQGDQVYRVPQPRTSEAKLRSNSTTDAKIRALQAQIDMWLQQDKGSHAHDDQIAMLRAQCDELRRQNEELQQQVNLAPSSSQGAATNTREKVLIPGRRTIIDGKKHMDLTTFRPGGVEPPHQRSRRRVSTNLSEFPDLTDILSDDEEDHTGEQSQAGYSGEAHASDTYHEQWDQQWWANENWTGEDQTWREDQESRSEYGQSLAR